jgi:hypothetical protein
MDYPNSPAVYTKGVAIQPNIPYNSGGVITAYRVSPPLPPGLNLDPGSGTISGTPTAVAPAAAYTVTASNSAGSITVALNLTVNEPAPTTRPVVTLDPMVTATMTGLAASTQNQGPGVTYVWSVAGGSITSGQGTPAITFPAGEPGPLSVSVTLSNSGGSISGTTDATVVPAPDSTLSLPDAVAAQDGTKWASVPEQPGMTYQWTIIPGTSSATITSGQGTSRIVFLAGSNPGNFQIQVKVQNQAGVHLSNSGTVEVK